MRQIAKMEQLQELALGIPSDYSEDPAAKTQQAYENIFQKMSELKGLEMQQPDLPEINLSMASIGDERC